MHNNKKKTKVAADVGCFGCTFITLWLPMEECFQHFSSQCNYHHTSESFISIRTSSTVCSCVRLHACVCEETMADKVENTRQRQLVYVCGIGGGSLPPINTAVNKGQI